MKPLNDMRVGNVASDPSVTILIVKLSSLGDVVQTIPVIHDILQHYPKANIDWVVEESFAQLLLGVKGIRTVIPVAQRRWRKQGLKQFTNPTIKREKQAFIKQLHQHRYDVVIDAQGLIKSGLIGRRAKLASRSQISPANIQLTKAVFVTTPFRATFGNRSESCGYEWPVRWMTDTHITMPHRIHAVQRTRLLCAKSLGYDEHVLSIHPEYSWSVYSTANKALNISDDSDKKGVEQTLTDSVFDSNGKTILLVHGSSRPDNAWPVENWRSLSRILTEHGYVVLLPHSNEQELNNAQIIASGNCSVHILRRNSLLNIAQTIQNSNGVIGLDTGLSHIAVALNKPCLQIFLHDRAWRAGPLTGAMSKPYQKWVEHLPLPSVQKVWAVWQDVKAASAQSSE